MKFSLLFIGTLLSIHSMAQSVGNGPGNNLETDASLSFATQRVRDVKLTSYGARVTLSYDKDCADIDVLCIPLNRKTKKVVICSEKDGKLVASMGISYRSTASQVSYTVQSEKNFKVRVNGLCNGETPDSLIINNVVIF